MKQMQNAAVQTKYRVNKKKKRTGAVIAAVLIAILVFLAALSVFFLLHAPERKYRGTAEGTQIGENGEILSGGEIGLDDEEQYNFLIVGRDRAAYNTDVMMLANYNLKKNSVSIMQIPRDTYINLGYSSVKANAILATYRNKAIRDKADDPEKIALEKFCETLSGIFGVQIDYYAMMDLNGFVNIVDAIGGVHLTVPYAMDYDDPYQNLHIHLKAGEQTLNGDQSEQFVRFRKGYVAGDIGRVDAQKIFINACIKAVKENFSVSTVSAIIEQTSKYLKTNIKAADAAYFAKKALSVNTDAITFLTIPGIQCRQYDTSGNWYYAVYRAATLEMLNTYFNSYNYLLTENNFDRDHVLYDEVGSYMYSLYMSDAQSKVYTAEDADDIRIPKTNPKPVSAEADDPADAEDAEMAEMPEFGEISENETPQTESPVDGMEAPDAEDNIPVEEIGDPDEDTEE